MTRLLHRLRREEGGWALATCLLLLTAMLGTGIALASIVDTQTIASAQQRERETAFSLAEAALNAEVFSLARDWPGRGQALTPYATCTPASTGARCPDAAQMRAHTSSPDAYGATWATEVHDNGGGVRYDDAATRQQPGYDADGDGQVWVRAQATAKGRTRAVAALVRAEELAEDVPHGALITGRLDISNMGKKAIIDASVGGSGQSGLVAVRCTPVLLELLPCAGHQPGSGGLKTLADLTKLLDVQIVPNVLTTGYTGPQRALTDDARARLKARAIADGTYYATCPSAAGLSGPVVWIENGACSYTGNDVFNTAQEPGVVILASGSIYLGGTTQFNGVINAANGGGVTTPLVQVQGNAQVVGGVLVDGMATTIAGSSKLNVRLDLNAYRKVASYGSAGVIQNTWREIR